MRAREQKWQVVALFISVGGHLAFLRWASPQPAPVERRAVTAEFIFDALPLEPPRPPPAVPPTAPERPPPRALPRPPRERPATEPLPARPSEVPSDAPREAPTSAPVAEQPKVTISLLPGSSFALALDAGITLVEEPPTGLRALEAPKDLVGSLTKETLGRGRVDRGLVHPYYSQLGKALLKHWDAERVAKSGLKGLAQQTQENFKMFNDIWADKAAEYGRSGNPMGDVDLGSNRRAAVNNNIQGVNGSDLEQRKELGRQLREAYKATRRAVIRVVQNEEGKLLKVELVQPSNDAKVDHEALVDVRTAAEKLPPPPPEALEGKATLSSLWSFELVVSISPPVPTFTFEFDEALGFIDMRLPLDRRIYKKVRLVSVE